MYSSASKLCLYGSASARLADWLFLRRVLGRIVTLWLLGRAGEKLFETSLIKFPGETIVSNNSPGSGLAIQHTQMRSDLLNLLQASQVAGKAELPARSFGLGF